MSGTAVLPLSSLELPSSLYHSLEQSSFLSTGLETPCSLHLSLEPPNLSIPDKSRQTLRSLEAMNSHCLSLELLSSLHPSQMPPNCLHHSPMM